jgi:vesicle transport through interaction with t-SNAREs protein 1
MSADQRRRLLEEQAERSLAMLEDARGVAEDTVDVGADTLRLLHGQRESIIRVHGLVDQADGNVSSASSVLTGMGRRITTDRAIAICIVLALVVIAIVVIFKVVKDHGV